MELLRDLLRLSEAKKDDWDTADAKKLLKASGWNLGNELSNKWTHNDWPNHELDMGPEGFTQHVNGKLGTCGSCLYDLKGILDTYVSSGKYEPAIKEGKDEKLVFQVHNAHTRKDVGDALNSLSAAKKKAERLEDDGHVHQVHGYKTGPKGRVLVVKHHLDWPHGDAVWKSEKV